jgi:nucleotide-binding universal stress UspA family protein
MTAKIVVGFDGSEPGNLALSYAKKLASLIGEGELILVYVVEWSPYSFLTPQENAERHKRREEEIAAAFARIVNPAVEALQGEGFAARGLVRHGHVAKILNQIAVDEGADQIVIARSSQSGLSEWVFGSSATNLVMHASVPVTVAGQGK